MRFLLVQDGQLALLAVFIVAFAHADGLCSICNLLPHIFFVLGREVLGAVQPRGAQSVGDRETVVRFVQILGELMLINSDAVVLQVEARDGLLSLGFDRATCKVLLVSCRLFLGRVELVLARQHLTQALPWLSLVCFEAVYLLADLHELVARLLLHYLRHNWSFHTPMNVQFRHVLRIQLL